MFVEIIEHLRCPRGHEESPLVLAATRSEARHVRDGVLGCPVCGAEFPIEHGVATFDGAETSAAEAPSSEAAMRLAAFLELTDARGFAVLCGRRAAHAALVREMAQTPLILVNPPEEAESFSVAAVIRTLGRLPFADASARAIALDDAVQAPRPADAVRIVRQGGRVTGPVTLAVPAGVTEIVRDDRDWVGEFRGAAEGPPSLVPLRRA